MCRSPSADLTPLIKLLQAGVSHDRAATELSRVLAIWTAELKDDDEQLQERLSGLAGKREPTPTFRPGLELTKLAVFGDGASSGIGERGVIRGA